MSKCICSVYKSLKKAGMYLYVEKKTGFERVPDALKMLFGEGRLAMTLLVTPEKKLANLSGEQLLKALDDQGYYLQMPPSETDEMLEIAKNNAKLPL